MSIQPPDPNVIQANLNARNANDPFTMRESLFYNSEQTMQVEYGISDAALTGAQIAMGHSAAAPLTPFSGIPTAASRAEFFDAVQIFANESGNFMDPDDAYLYGNSRPNLGANYQNQYNLPNPYMGPNQTTGAPAPITEVPTSTINPDRPRTVAAGYDPSRRCLTVVFRDGTYYNYYEVTNAMWQNFKRARSKGRFIYTFLDSHPRGVADVSQLTAGARETLYRLSRTGQIKKQGLTGRQVAGGRSGSGKQKYGTKTMTNPNQPTGVRGGVSRGGGTGRKRGWA
jgi:KTSC domain